MGVVRRPVIKGIPEERGLPDDQAETTRPDYQASANDNVIIQGIEGSDSSLGWVGFAYAQEAGAISKSSRSPAMTASASRRPPTPSPIGPIRYLVICTST